MLEFLVLLILLCLLAPFLGHLLVAMLAVFLLWGLALGVYNLALWVLGFGWWLVLPAVGGLMILGHLEQLKEQAAARQAK